MLDKYPFEIRVIMKGEHTGVTVLLEFRGTIPN